MTRMIVLHPDGERTETTHKTMPGLGKLQRAVGGAVQRIPLFDSFDGERCKALSNAEGAARRELRVNRQATDAWLSALTASGNDAMFDDDILGPVVLLFD